jgi:hypothetical protein
MNCAVPLFLEPIQTTPLKGRDPSSAEEFSVVGSSGDSQLKINSSANKDK